MYVSASKIDILFPHRDHPELYNHLIRALARADCGDTMDRSCQDYCLTEDERIAFERDGFFIVQNALDPDRVDRLTRSVDRLDGLFRDR